jgi:transcriptional regulator with XRE-family HTH domain
MRTYQQIGQLLVDFRKINSLSQSDFASVLGVDVRTVNRWENGNSLINPEMEVEIVRVTLLPYQLIRNLNANHPIPTYYDFSLRKYAMSSLNEKLPSAKWFKARLEVATHRIRELDHESDIDYLEKYMQFHKRINRNLSEVIKESSRLLPDMNLVITDDSGYYSGHSLIFPISEDAYRRLRSQEMKESELTVEDLEKPEPGERRIYYGYDITADCNDNIFFLVGQLLRVIRDHPEQNYLYCATPMRSDNFELNNEIGLKIIWEGEKGVNQFGLEIAPRFQEGNFKDFLR